MKRNNQSPAPSDTEAANHFGVGCEGIAWRTLCAGGSGVIRTRDILIDSQALLPLNYGTVYPAEAGSLICNDDLINGNAKNMRKYHQIVERWQRITAHPFEYGLRSVEPADVLNLGDLDTVCFDKRFYIGASRGHVDRRHT